ncbi:oligosaccharide flippase family protein [bacterium]|nr:oligosaccharide flippase family protein [bacterium]MBU4510907.1 oligosaccharide flippase family protein [bacterium]
MNIRKIKLFNILYQSYLVKAFSFYTLSNAISAITSIAILSFYTKFLPPEDFGKMSLMWVFVIIASVVIDGRLNTAFSIRYYKVSKEENIKNIYTVFAYNLIVYSLVYFVFLLYPSLFQKILGIQIITTDLNVVFFLILFMIFGNFYTNFLMVSQKPKSYFFMKLTFNIILIISSLIFLIVLRDGYISYLKAYLSSYFIVAVIGLKYFFINFKPHKKNVISISNLKDLLRLGLPLVPDALMLMLLTWADRYILNLYVGLTIIGVYTVGYKFSGIINSFIVTPFGQAISPMLFKQFANSLDEYKKTVARIFKYYWLIMFTLVIGYFVFLKEIYQLIINVKYIEGYNIIAIVLFGIIFYGGSGLFGATVIMKEKTGKIFLFTFISVFVNIGLNFILIPKHGMYGAAVATLFSYILQFIMLFIYAQKLVFINYDYKFIFKSSIICLCFFALILFLSYLEINIILKLSLKVISFLSFGVIAYKFLDLKESIKGILDYVIKPKESIS